MELSEAAAVERVLAGDSEAFRSLVEGHSRRLFAVAYRMTGNVQDADDVVQETFLRAYRQIGSFRSGAAVGTWLHRITVNCALDLMKSKERRLRDSANPVEDVELPTEPPQQRDAERADVRRAVSRALDCLSANERIAFVLRHYEERSLEEIGEILGTRINATKNTIFRAVRKLRHELAPLVKTP